MGTSDAVLDRGKVLEDENVLDTENVEDVLDKENIETGGAKETVHHTLTKAQQKYLPLKRAIDVVLSGGAIVLLSPVLGVISLAIKLDSPGPVLFKQKRVGRNCEFFEIWKFRSMRTDTPKDMPTHMLNDPDAFITKTGRFLRKTSLDELPQIFNIFRGQMSIIGPRPALWNQDDLVAERDKYGANDVTPGLTGWAQINGRDELEIPVKAKFDGEYVEKMSLWMDIKCFLGTIGSVLSHDGVVEGGTGEMHKEGEKTGDGSEVLVSPEKINKEIKIGAAVVGVAGAVGVGTLVAIGKHFLGKKEKEVKKEKGSHLAVKLIGGAALIGTAATVYTNIRKKNRLQDQLLNAESAESVSPSDEHGAEDDVDLKPKRILITGANSYIGISVENWLNKTPELYTVDTLDVIGDSWRSYDFSSYDVVFHVAGIVHIKETKENASLYYKINRDLAVEIAKKAKAAGVNQFIFMSTMSVYGVDTGVITKNTVPHPTTNYGKSKLEAERSLENLSDNNFRVAILRPPMVYGKGCKGNFQELLKLVNILPVFPNVKNCRSMIYIDNLCSFIKLCVDRNLSGIYFPQNAEYMKTSEMAEFLAQDVGKKLYLSKMLGLGVDVIMPFVKVARKGFGTLVYKDTEDFNFSYCVLGNKESLEELIKRDTKDKFQEDKVVDEPIRVLNVVGRMDRGGIETLIMNIYRNIDRSKVQFDFLAHYGKEDADYNEEIKSMGGRIYEMPVIKTTEKVYYAKVFEYISALKKFFKEHPEYKIVHGHMTNTASIYMPIAKRYGNVECCIAHSHLAQTQKTVSKFTNVATDVLRIPLRKCATDYFACSQTAARWLFSEEDIASGKVKFIHNAVDTSNFEFDINKRRKYREELGIEEDQIVIGHVGRFYHPKNHEFIVDIFKTYHESNPKARLLLVGDGELIEHIKDKVKDNGLEAFVIFTGVRSDVPELMQTMDVFLMPSLYEGLPVVGIEAQASGLPCLFSTAVTTEVALSKRCKFLDLSRSATDWCEEINSMIDENRAFDRKEAVKDVIKAGYDIKSVASELEKFYLSRG